MAEPHCPRCLSEVVERAGRAGRARGASLSIAYTYPFRCQSCLHRFRSMAWGQRCAARTRLRRRGAAAIARHAWTSRPRSGSKRASAPARARSLRRRHRPETDAALKLGQHVGLDLQPARDDPPIRVEVAVVRSVGSGRAGLQFVQVKDDDGARLKNISVRLRDSGPPPSVPPPARRATSHECARLPQVQESPGGPYPSERDDGAGAQPRLCAVQVPGLPASLPPAPVG